MKKRFLTKWLVLLSFLCGTMTNTVSAVGYDVAYPAVVSKEASSGENLPLSEAGESEGVKESTKDEQDSAFSEGTSQAEMDTETTDPGVNDPKASEGESTEGTPSDNVSQPETDGETADDALVESETSNADSSAALTAALAEIPENQGYIYLSDISYDASMSGTKHDSIKMDQNSYGNNISLVVNGSSMEFYKGIFAHATSTVVYDISDYSDVFTRFTSYVGVDRSQGNKGNGVWFSISVSQDGKAWNEIEKSPVLKGDSEAHFFDIDITNAKYIRLYANDNGANGNDHAVYGFPRILKPDYDDSEEIADGIKTVSEYDEILKRDYTIDQEITGEYEKLLLLRTFVNRVGYNNILTASLKDPEIKTAVEWLTTDIEALRMYVNGGEIESGSYLNSLTALGDLYAAYKDDFSDVQNGELYKKLVISISLSHARTIRLWTGNGPVSVPVERYRLFKALYTDGRMAKGGNTELFKQLPVELMRWVVDSKIDDEEIDWLVAHALKTKDKGGSYLDAYTYITYTMGFNYNREKYYLPENYDSWNEKYDIANLSGYGQQGVHKLWMVFEEGSVCGGLAKTYANLAQVFGMPAAVIGQPGHAAALTYSLNSKGQGIWSIKNDITGWVQSEKGERLLLGWGSKNWDSYYNVSYVLLAQHALNDYANLEKAMLYNYLADVYEGEPDKQIEIYNKALEIQNFNLDSLVGLIDAYKADGGKTSAEYLALANRVAEGLAYFPLPFSDVMNLLNSNITTSEDRIAYDALKSATLDRALQATENDTEQPNACIAMAKYLKGDNDFQLADFSFDGENAGKIIINEKYDDYKYPIDYSLDGGENWTTTYDHVIALTEEQIAGITTENDIKLKLSGTSQEYTIDILTGERVTTDIVTKNDDENTLVGKIANLQYSLDEGETWKDYTSDITFEGDQVVKVRYKAHGRYLDGAMDQFTFHEDTNPDTIKYIPVKHISFVSAGESQSGQPAKNMIDASPFTTWHTKYGQVADDKSFVVSFDTVRYLSQISYDPAGTNGRVKTVAVYTSLNGEDWVLAGQSSVWGNNTSRKTLTLEESSLAKYVKIVATATYGNGSEPADKYVSGTRYNYYEDPTKIYEEEMPVIKYSPDSATNQDVTAMLVLPDGFTAVGETSHTFTDNGDYTFTYLNMGKEQKTITASVDWIDKKAPTAEVKYDITGPTNKDVTATLVNESETITVTNNEGSKSHTFTENGEFVFEIRDEVGNTAKITASVNWIDKKAPTAEVKYDITGPTNKDVTATLVNESETITVTNNEGSKSHTFTENGEFVFEIRDEVGNTAKITASVNWIDKKAPTAEVKYDITGPTNKDVTVTLVNESKPITVTNNEGSKSHTFTENGEFVFEIVDEAGNTAKITASVDWIDKTPPVVEIRYEIVNGRIVATVASGEEITILNNNGFNSHALDESGRFTFTIQDRVGNITEITASLDQVDSSLLASLDQTDSKRPVNSGDTTPLKVSGQNSSTPQTGDKNDLVLIRIVGIVALAVFLRLVYTTQRASKQEG